MQDRIDAGMRGMSRTSARHITFRALQSVEEIPRAAWERLLPGDPESWDFYRAIEGVPPSGFQLGAIAAMRGDEVVAAAPTFRVAYRLDTPFQGHLREVGDWVYGRWPRLVSFPVLGLGSPMSDNCSIGFAPEFSDEDRRRIFEGMLQQLVVVARARKCVLIAIKSIGGLADVLDEPLTQHGYQSVTSVPLVMLKLPFRTLDDYFSSLPKDTGSYLRRKFKSVGEIKTEYRSSIAGLESRIYDLFRSTLNQSKIDHGEFQQVQKDYFSRVVAGVGEKAPVMLCWRNDELLSFQLCLVGRDCLIAKNIGMKYPEARQFNLYFVNCLKVIEFAIKRGIPAVELGATSYATKLLFGGHMERRLLYFRFRRSISNTVFRPLAPLFDFERNDPELQQLFSRQGTNQGPRAS